MKTLAKSARQKPADYTGYNDIDHIKSEISLQDSKKEKKGKNAFKRGNSVKIIENLGNNEGERSSPHHYYSNSSQKLFFHD